MDYDNNLDLTNVYIQDFDKMVDPMVTLKNNIFNLNIKNIYSKNLPPVSIAVKIIPQDHTSTGSPRYGVLAQTYNQSSI